jgi:hypothetical protein
MRHDPFTGVFNSAYINESVRFNVQDAFLESDISDDGLTRVFTHMSLRCNQGAPEVSKELMDQLLAMEPEIVQLDRQFKESRIRLRREYGAIKQAPMQVQKVHKELGNQLRNATKSFRTEIEGTNRKDYLYRIHNERIKRQLQRHLDTVRDEDPGEPQPVVQHQLEERMRTQEVLCNLSKDLSFEDITARKVLAINCMVALASRQVPQTHKPIPACGDLVKKEPLSSPNSQPFPQLDEFPLTLGNTQCIFCIGNERYPYDQRTRTFKRVSHMRDHVESVHLKRLDQLIHCSHPVCKAQGLVFSSVTDFKNHVATVHRVNLR